MLANTHVNGFPPNGPTQTGDRSSCCILSMERAKSRWARSGARIQCYPSNPRQQPHKQDGPRRRQAGRAPPSLRMGACLAEPYRFEGSEASVMLGARKPERKWAQSHQAWDNSLGGDPGQTLAHSQGHPELGKALKFPDPTLSLMPGAVSMSCLGSACTPPMTGSSLSI